MSAYLIANVKVTDDSWIPEYAQTVHDLMKKYGGKYLSRSGNITLLEGNLPDYDVIALVEFPSVEDCQAFVDSAEYAPFAKSRQSGAACDFYVIDDTDLTGGIPYLPPG